MYIITIRSYTVHGGYIRLFNVFTTHLKTLEILTSVQVECGAVIQLRINKEKN